jgi:hypothetical protein
MEAARELPAPGNPFLIAEALNAKLQAAVDEVRTNWELGGHAELNLGSLYQPWEQTRAAGGLLAVRPSIPGLRRFSCSDLGIEEPVGGWSHTIRGYGFLRFGQMIGHARIDFPSFPVDGAEVFALRSMDVGVLAIDSEDGWTLEDINWPLSSYQERRICFFLAGAAEPGRLRDLPVLGSRVDALDPQGRWNANRPAPQSQFRSTYDGMITILASDDYSRDQLITIDRFLCDCLERRSGMEHPWDMDSRGPSLENIRDWVRVKLGGSDLSPAARLAERWLTEYTNHRTGTQKLYPPVEAWSVGDL